MTVETPSRPPQDLETTAAPAEALTAFTDLDADEALAPTVSPREGATIGLAAFLSSVGTGWMCSSLFSGSLPHAIAVLGCLLGAGTVAVSYRSLRPTFVQLLVVPVTLVVGALLVIPSLGHGQSLPGAVTAAVRQGGLQFAPVRFSAGWHFLLLLLTSLLSAACAALAAGVGKPRLATFMPLPLLFAASLIQPKNGGFVATGVGLGCVVASLAVSYGAELSREESTSAGFELRRLLRAGSMMAGLGAVLALVGQAGFLFPPASPSPAVPPRHPQTPPPVADKLLFTVASRLPVTVRMGVLDGYADDGWLTPPYDPALLREVGRSGNVPADSQVPVAPPSTSLRPADTLQVTFSLAGLTGNVLPDVAQPLSFSPGAERLAYDPRTQILQTSAPPHVGLSYSMTAAAPPSAKQMQAATLAPPALAEFTHAPAKPDAVAALLAKAPTNQFDRVQYVRTALYKKVVAKGAGTPKSVSPADVVGMLAGKTANPYQIVGAEALLARWAGLPARIGYGYFSTTRTADKSGYAIYAHDGASWLEVYFGGLGWVPLIGQPLHAQASLSSAKPNRKIEPTRQLALVVYVPVRLKDTQQLYTLVRYWVAVVAPYVLGLALAWTFWPGVVKALRRRRRARWARRRGPRERILAAYADLRDSARDLGIGTHGDLPIAFLDRVSPDDEHAELAWLVTRALWGDLVRDLRDEDADAAQRMASSVRRRLVTAQTATNRAVAIASRSSLRDPYTWEIPALWRPRRAPTKRHWSVRRIGRRAVASPAALVALMALVLAPLLGGCAATTDAAPLRVTLPARIAPTELKVGSQTFQIHREQAAESAFAKAGPASLVAHGQVFTIRLNTAVQASLQVGAFKPDVDARQEAIRKGILASLGAGKFTKTSLPNGSTVYSGSLPSQRLDVWFPPSGRFYDLLVSQESFADRTTVLADIISYQGEPS